MKPKLLPLVAVLCALTTLIIPTEHKVTADTPGLVPNFKPSKLIEPLPEPKMVEAVHVEPLPVPAPVAPPVTSSGYSGTGDQWLDWIVQHESGGNPFAMNSIGACGLFQALPCSKLGCNLADVQCQINWGRNYCISAYGSTYNAYLFWQVHRWY